MAKYTKHSIQSLLMEVISKEMSPTKMLAAFIIKTANDQGAGDLAPHQAQLEKAISEWMSTPTPGGDSISFSTDDGLPVVKALQLSVDGPAFEKFLRESSRAVGEAMPDALKKVAGSVLKAIKKIATDELPLRRFNEAAFQERLFERWGKAFDLLLLELELARECGEWCAKRLLTKKRKRRAPLIETTFLLHARACRVAGEIRALLEAGYVAGAYARWRTLYEIVVISDFLFKHGDSAAQLYLEHVDIDSWLTASHFKEKGGEGISKRELDKIERSAMRLKAKHGKAFGSPYGWAAVVMKEHHATFADIERSIGWDHVRPIYKLASNAVHAGPKGALFKLGLLDGWEPILVAGPSNARLDEPGSYTAGSLMQITGNLLLLRVNADTLVWSHVMLALYREVQEAFAQAQRRLVRDERMSLKAVSADIPVANRYVDRFYEQPRKR